MKIGLDKLCKSLNIINMRYGDILVYIGEDHGSDITEMTTDDYDLVRHDEDLDFPTHLIIGKDVSRE